MNPYVRSVKAINSKQLELLFENGERRLFDMSPYLSRGVFTRLQNPAVFRMAQVVAGSVEWPGEIDLSYDTLYLESQPEEICKNSSPLSAASMLI